MAPRQLLLYLAMLPLGISACSSLPETGLTGHIVAIEIGPTVDPAVSRAFIGDEIRWHNARREPVTVGLLTSLTRTDLACARGFTRFRWLDDFVTLPPDGSASLCLARPGTVQFNVWFDTNNPRGTISPLATIKVSARSG